MSFPAFQKSIFNDVLPGLLAGNQKRPALGGPFLCVLCRLDVVVQEEFVVMRAQANGVYLFDALVGDVGFQEI